MTNFTYLFGIYRSGTTMMSRLLRGSNFCSSASDPLRPFFNAYTNKLIDDKYYLFSINKNNQIINIFFDKKTLNIVGWQTEDLYQNLSVTFIYDLGVNVLVDNKKFKLPEMY